MKTISKICEIFVRNVTVECDVDLEVRCLVRRMNLPIVGLVLENMLGN